MPKQNAQKHESEKTEVTENQGFAQGFGEDQPTPQLAPSDDAFTWTASEFIAHEKNSNWYVVLVLVTIVLTGFIYLITRDILSGLAIVIGMALLGVYAGREPRELEYSLRPEALYIGDKKYPYESFRCYSVFSDGSFKGIDFLPLKRFSLMLTIYYHPDDEEQILAILNASLPEQDHKPDFVDRFLRKIRF